MARKRNLGRTASAALVGAGVGAAVVGFANAIMPADTMGDRARATTGGLLSGAVLGAVGGLAYRALSGASRAMNPVTTTGAIGMGTTIGAFTMLGNHIRNNAA